MALFKNVILAMKDWNDEVNQRLADSEPGFNRVARKVIVLIGMDVVIEEAHGPAAPSRVGGGHDRITNIVQTGDGRSRQTCGVDSNKRKQAVSAHGSVRTMPARAERGTNYIQKNTRISDKQLPCRMVAQNNTARPLKSASRNSQRE
jgi:hypothetical protein